MFCVHCGKEIEENAAFCSNCGTKQASTVYEPQETKGATVFHSVFGSNTFHIATVFFLVYVCASALANIVNGILPFSIFHIFITIALFRLHSLAKKDAPLFAFASPLKTLRVVIKIYRVLLWIAVGFLAFAGVIITLLGIFSSVSSAEILEELLNESNIAIFGGAFLTLGGIALYILGIIVLSVAVLVAVMNIFCFGAYYKAAKSAEWTAGTGVYQLKGLGATYGWMIFTIVSVCISTLSALTALDNPANIIGLVANGFFVVFSILMLNCINQAKNSRQIENL